MSTIDFTLPENQHPAVRLFPLMPPDELKELAEDIKKNGQRDPVQVVYTYDGPSLLLDGQNRVAACAIAKVNPRVECIHLRNFSDDGDLLRYVLSKNMKRRHLTPAQRGAIAVSASDLLAQLQREAKERRDAELAKENLRRKAIKEAAQAVQKDPEGADAILNQSEGTAVPEAKQPSKRTCEKIAALADIGKTLAQSLLNVQKYMPELLSQIIAGTLSVEVAERHANAACLEKMRKERAAKAATKPKKQAKPKPEREYGIFKVGAVLLAKDTARWEHGEEIVLPVLATVTKVSQSWATLNVGDAKAPVMYCMEKPKSGPRTKPTGTHYFECVRVATAADKKLVYQVWEAIRRKAAA